MCGGALRAERIIAVVVDDLEAALLERERLLHEVHTRTCSSSA